MFKLPKLKNTKKALELKISEQEKRIRSLEWTMDSCVKVIKRCNEKFNEELQDYNEKHTIGCAVIKVGQERLNNLKISGYYKDDDIKLELNALVDNLNIRLTLKRKKHIDALTSLKICNGMKGTSEDTITFEPSNLKDLVKALEALNYYFLIEFDTNIYFYCE